MNQITVRFQTLKRDFDPDFMDRLHRVADEYGIVMLPDNEAFTKASIDRESFMRESKQVAERSGPVQSDSTDDIRRVRDLR